MNTTNFSWLCGLSDNHALHQRPLRAIALIGFQDEKKLLPAN